MTSPDAPDTKAMLKMILQASGGMFLAGGAFILLSPSTVSDLLHFDAMMTQILGGALMVVGITDIIIADKLFGKDKR